MEWAEYNERMAKAGCDSRMGMEDKIGEKVRYLQEGDLVFPPEIPSDPTVRGVITRVVKPQGKRPIHTGYVTVAWSDEKGNERIYPMGGSGILVRYRRHNEILDWELIGLESWEHFAATRTA